MAKQDEFDFDDDDNVVSQETENTSTIEIEADESAISIEIEDDTPPEDRGRKPLPKEQVEELEKDDLAEYSAKVKDRMAKLRKVYHDERREKEAAKREQEAAIRYAQSIAEENKRLKATLGSGEDAYLDAIKKSVDYELNLAKKEYREAYDSGDAEKIIEAQQKLNSAQFKLTEVENYRPQYKNAGQNDEAPVNIQPERPQAPKPDRRALEWNEKNDWFGSDSEMTSLALGVHEKLIAKGVSPNSDEYYRSIDNTMRKRFPEYDWGDTLDEEKPSQRANKTSTVVASASRTTAPKTVKLTASQVALAKKLGLTPEAYAKELMKVEKR
jgi:hypothetical protein